MIIVIVLAMHITSVCTLNKKYLDILNGYLVASTQSMDFQFI